MDNREAIEQELEWRRCQENVFYFLENYWYIKIVGGNSLFKLRGPQQQALQTWLDNRQSVSLKARQIGWSTLVAAYAFWLIFFHADRYIIMLSRNEREAKKLLAKSKYGFARLPDWMLERGPKVSRQNQLELVFDNESNIESLPSRENAARGDTAFLIIVDEWAHLNYPEEAWASIEPAAERGGQIIGISTAKGFGNWFHRFYQAAENGANGFVAMFFPWASTGDRTEEWYAQKVRDLEPWQLHQEYPATAEEAFVASGNVVYDTDMLKERIQVLSPQYVGVCTWNKHRDPDLSIDDNGPLDVWELPQPGMSYVIGADPAAGVPDGDSSTATIIKVNTNKVVAVYEDIIVPEDFAEALDVMGRWYNTAYLGVERNNHGITVCRNLAQKLDYPRLHFHTRENVNRTVTRIVGYQTTTATKPVMVNELGAALRRGKLIIHCENTLAQLIAYQRQQSPNGQYETFNGYPHDDLVISLGIANLMLDEVTVSSLEEGWEPEGMTWDFCDRLIGAAQALSHHYTAGYDRTTAKRQERFVVHGPL